MKYFFCIKLKLHNLEDISIISFRANGVLKNAYNNYKIIEKFVILKC